MREVVISAEVNAAEGLCLFATSQEGKWAGIGGAIADTAYDGVHINADLGMSSNGRKEQHERWSKKPQFH
jgi:hypothetical protein